MYIIIPIYFSNAEELKQLSSDFVNCPLYLMLAKKIDNAFRTKMMAFTDHPAVFHMAKQMQIECRMLECYEEESILPKGALASIDYLKESKKISTEEPLMIIDFRTALLSVRTIEEITQQYSASSSKPLVSMVASTDHPAQLNAYYQICYLDTFAFLDWGFDEWKKKADKYLPTDDLIASRPFYFSWLSHGIINDESVYAAVFSKPARLRMIPVEKLRHFRDFCPVDGSSLYLFNSTETARRLVRTSWLNNYKNKKLCGVPVFGSADRAVCMLLEGGNGRHVIFSVKKGSVGNVQLRAWPYLNGKLLENRKICVNLENDRGAYHKNEHRQVSLADEALIMKRDLQIDGYIVALLKQCDEGEADFCDPLTCEQGYFSINFGNGKRINLLTGKLINGSQELPPLFQYTSAVCILQARQAKAFPKMLTNGQVQGFKLPVSEALYAANPLDRLKMQLRMKDEARVQ